MVDQSYQAQRRSSGRLLVDVMVAMICLLLCFFVLMWHRDPNISTGFSVPRLSLVMLLISVCVVPIMLSFYFVAYTGPQRTEPERQPIFDRPQPIARTARPRTARHQRRRGAVALEMAIVIVIFLIAILGMIELSRAIMVHQILVNTAREATRRAIVPGATDDELTGSDGIITKYVEAAGIPATYTVGIEVNGNPGTVNSANSFDEIQVNISVPFSDVSWGMMRFFPSDTTLTSAVVMRKE